VWDKSTLKLYPPIDCNSFVFTASQLAAIVDGIQSYMDGKFQIDTGPPSHELDQ